jgi:hypothetical protein
MEPQKRADGSDRAAPMVAASERRVRRELETVGAMIELYCRNKHGMEHDLCADCRSLREYAEQRVSRCPLIEDKPTCVNCRVHCYKPIMRERIKAVMRNSGPRMMWRHPILSIRHVLDGRRDRSRASITHQATSGAAIRYR